jgi:large subunit ribosomal protein L21
MYAIVNIAGQQMKVAKDQQVYVNRLPNKEGDKVTFDEVLLVDDNGKVNVGAPAVSGASVSAKVVEHLKGDKVIVFKKKRRKGYQTRNGHRQLLTKIAIDGITIGKAKKEEKKADEAPKKKAAPKAEAPKAEEKKATAHKKEEKKTQTDDKN